MNFEDFESSESELDFEINNDNFLDFEAIVDENEANYDTVNSSDSDIVVQRKRKLKVVESDTDNNESDSAEDYGDNWVDVTENENVFEGINFSVSPQNPGPQVSSSVVEPLQFFKLFFTNQLVDEIINETNNYAKTQISSKTLSKNSIWNTWEDVDKDEFWAFLGVILNMGTMPVANIQEYWSTNPNSKIPFFSHIFTRRRFNQIFWMLHLKTPVTQSQHIKTRIEKVSHFLEFINSKFSEYFIPAKNICVDESIVKFKGRISFITYNPNKPTKWGIRIYVLADCETGYAYGILPYYGSLTTENLIRPDLPVSTRIPLQLYQNLLQRIPTAQGYHMHTDRYFTSIPLAEELTKLKCHLTGTIQINRKGVPLSIKKPKFKKTTVAYKKDKKMLLAWKDKRIVTLLTSCDNAGMTSKRRVLSGGKEIMVRKPNIVINYTTSMGAVDRIDHYASTYCFMRKSLKWWRKLFFWGMEMCAINSYILYQVIMKTKNEKPLTHLKFVKLLVDQCVGNFSQERRRASSSASENRLNGKLHVMRKAAKRDCVVCSNREKKGERHVTPYYCDTCANKPRMHVGDCFYRYHTMKEFKHKK